MVREMANGKFKFVMKVPDGKLGRIEVSTDMVNWVALKPDSISPGTLEVEDADAVGYLARFYRVKVE